MSTHQRPGKSDEWYTPRHIFAALALNFDLDPASPGPHHWVPARHVFTAAQDGLSQPWDGLVWLNPPFGGRNGQVPWLKRFLAHGNGICLVNALTSSGWFHRHAILAETLLFPKGKTRFISASGEEAKSPPNGVVLLGMGLTANRALQRSGLGWFVDNRAPEFINA